MNWNFVSNLINQNHLNDEDNDVRRAALDTLGKLHPDVLAPHVDAIMVCLRDAHEDVRQAARRHMPTSVC